MTKKLVLAIEDNQDMRELIRLALRRSNNYEVKTVASAKEAFEFLSFQDIPAIILLDMNLSDMDGAEFMQKLKTVPKYQQIKVILVSGVDKITLVSKEIGADGFIKKPFEVSQFSTEIEKQATSSL